MDRIGIVIALFNLPASLQIPGMFALPGISRNSCKDPYYE